MLFVMRNKAGEYERYYHRWRAIELDILTQDCPRMADLRYANAHSYLYRYLRDRALQREKE